MKTQSSATFPRKTMQEGCAFPFQVRFFPYFTLRCKLRVLNDLSALTASYCTSSIPSHELQQTPEDSNAAEWRRLWVSLSCLLMAANMMINVEPCGTIHLRILPMLQLWKENHINHLPELHHKIFIHIYTYIYTCMYVYHYITYLGGPHVMFPMFLSNCRRLCLFLGQLLLFQRLLQLLHDGCSSSRGHCIVP